MKLDEHPTVKRYRQTHAAATAAHPSVIDAAWLRQTCVECGADDVAAVSIEHPDLASHREAMRTLLPDARCAVHA